MYCRLKPKNTHRVLAAAAAMLSSNIICPLGLAVGQGLLYSSLCRASSSSWVHRLLMWRQQGLPLLLLAAPAPWQQQELLMSDPWTGCSVGRMSCL
jgi:hypothetical protein